MPRYLFNIFNGRPYHDKDGEYLADDETAWRCALRTVRDIEDILRPGDRWQLDVNREATPLFRIEIQSKKL
jgi:hypothetical protein